MYQDHIEIKRIHGTSNIAVIPTRIATLGTISKNAKDWYGPDIIGSAQLPEILGTARVYHKLLCH